MNRMCIFVAQRV